MKKKGMDLLSIARPKRVFLYMRIT
ncbi:UNVERIFIED_CONTAM: hypothetical protein GTU68_025956 [Idotea baltica]|nr:hypothetical protein [Idotea baltica]